MIMNNDKKIVLVTDSDFPSGSASAKLLRLLSYGLSENGWNVSVLLQKGKLNCNIEQEEIEGCNLRNINYHYFAWKYRPSNIMLKFFDNIICFFGVIFKLIQLKFTNKVDVVLVYNHFGIQNLAPLLTSKLLRIPTATYVADWLTKDISFPKPSQIIKYWNFEARMRYINFCYDSIITTSTFISNFYLSKGFHDTQIFILPNLVELPQKSNNINDDYPKNKKYRITFSGKPTWTNGGEMLLDIFHKVYLSNENCELLIMGDQLGNNKLIPELKERARKLGILENVIFTGMIPYQKVIQNLLTSDILILPRPAGQFAEAGFPTKLGEYLASNKPVVVTSVGDIPKYLIDKDSALLCKSGDIDEFTQSILWLIDNPHEAKKIASNGYEWVSKNLYYLNASKKIIDFLSPILK